MERNLQRGHRPRRFHDGADAAAARGIDAGGGESPSRVFGSAKPNRGIVSSASADANAQAYSYVSRAFAVESSASFTVESSASFAAAF